MKKALILLGFMFLIGCSFSIASDNSTVLQVAVKDLVKFSPPAEKIIPKIAINGEEIIYTICLPGPHGFKAYPPLEVEQVEIMIQFRTTLDGKLESGGASKGDFIVFSWEGDLGYDEFSQGDRFKGIEVDIRAWKKFFQAMALPPLRLEAEMTKSYFDNINGDTEFEWVGIVMGRGINPDKHILKGSRLSLIEISEKELMFPLPKTGKFRLGKKLGLFIPIVAGKINDMDCWVVPVVEYLPK